MARGEANELYKGGGENMKDKNRTEQDLTDIAVSLITSLKPKGLTVGELREVVTHMAEAIEHIHYGP